MWKPTSIVMAVEYAQYVEELLGSKGDSKLTNPPQTGFMGKAPRPCSRRGYSRPPPYGN